jgi:UDPglucose 6-dehydrogenase
MKIGFIGIGKLGLPCAEQMALGGHQVTGYDTVTRTSNQIEIADHLSQAVEGKDIVFIAVPTPHDPAYDGREPTAHLTPKDFDYTIVESVLEQVDAYASPEQLVVLISTVLPGTVRRQLRPCITQARFVYNPYLIAMGSVAWDMVNPEMVMIGTEDGSLTGDAARLIEFYKTIMQNNPRYEVGTWDECECIKVFYNTFISTKIGLANMILDVAERQGNINVDVVTNALARSTMRIMGPQYMTAGMGDGGGCHPRDNIALRYMAQELGMGYDLFDAVMTARERQAENLAQRLCTLAQERNLPIYIHGRAYKPGVAYEDGSYSLLVGHYCLQAGYPVVYIDPLTGHGVEGEVKGIVLLAHSASTTYKYTHTEQLDSLYCELAPGSVVVDPWRKYENERLEVIHWGNTRLVGGV